MSKSNSVGTKLNIGSGAGAVTVGGLTSINGIEITAETIDWLAEDVKHTAKGLLTDWNADRRAGVDDLHAAD